MAFARVFVSVLILCAALRPHHSHICSLTAVILCFLLFFSENLAIFSYFPLKVCLKRHSELLKILLFVVTKGISSACNPQDENDDAKES